MQSSARLISTTIKVNYKIFESTAPFDWSRRLLAAICVVNVYDDFMSTGEFYYAFDSYLWIWLSISIIRSVCSTIIVLLLSNGYYLMILVLTFVHLITTCNILTRIRLLAFHIFICLSLYLCWHLQVFTTVLKLSLYVALLLVSYISFTYHIFPASLTWITTVK